MAKSRSDVVVWIDPRCPPQVEAMVRADAAERGQRVMPVLNRRSSDEKAIAERRWRAGTKPAKAQQSCDHGLFSDDAKQQDLF